MTASAQLDATGGVVLQWCDDTDILHLLRDMPMLHLQARCQQHSMTVTSRTEQHLLWHGWGHVLFGFAMQPDIADEMHS